jgi:PKD repeat protein
MVTFAAHASDPDGDAVTLSAAGLPVGATFTNGTLTWVPTKYQAGTYVITVSASDGTLTASQDVTVNVMETNGAPVLGTISDATTTEGWMVSLYLNATDPDGDVLTYSASGLPAGATLTGQTFSWRPAYNQAGTHTVTFAVKDEALSDSQAVTLTVLNDEDQDGFADGLEGTFGTAANRGCAVPSQRPADGGPSVTWPADLSTVGTSFNLLDQADIDSFQKPVNHFNTKVGQAGYDARWDVRRDGVINLQDMMTLVIIAPGMFNGQRAWNYAGCPTE